MKYKPNLSYAPVVLSFLMLDPATAAEGVNIPQLKCPETLTYQDVIDIGKPGGKRIGGTTFTPYNSEQYAENISGRLATANLRGDGKVLGQHVVCVYQYKTVIGTYTLIVTGTAKVEGQPLSKMGTVQGEPIMGPTAAVSGAEEILQLPAVKDLEKAKPGISEKIKEILTGKPESIKNFNIKLLVKSSSQQELKDALFATKVFKDLIDKISDQDKKDLLMGALDRGDLITFYSFLLKFIDINNLTYHVEGFDIFKIAIAVGASLPEEGKMYDNYVKELSFSEYADFMLQLHDGGKKIEEEIVGNNLLASLENLFDHLLNISADRGIRPALIMYADRLVSQHKLEQAIRYTEKLTQEEIDELSPDTRKAIVSFLEKNPEWTITRESYGRYWKETVEIFKYKN